MFAPCHSIPVFFGAALVLVGKVRAFCGWECPGSPPHVTSAGRIILHELLALYWLTGLASRAALRQGREVMGSCWSLIIIWVCRSARLKLSIERILSYYLPYLSKIILYPSQNHGISCKTSIFQFSFKMNGYECDSGKLCANGELCFV